MANTVRVNFGGVVTDLEPLHLRDGQADVALNVTMEDGKLEKRYGFAEFEDDAAGTGGAIKYLDVARFSDGSAYVVAKVGATLYRRKSDASVFTAITSGCTHSANDRGWSFPWADRFHYFDRNGGSRWNPNVNSGTAYKAGLRRPSAGPAGTAAAGGQKDGRYRVVLHYKNSVTKEEGQMTSPYTPATACSIESNTGGISISNYATLADQDRDYEWDVGVFSSTLGSTEYIARGTGQECPSWRFYRDVEKTKTWDAGTSKWVFSGGVGLNKADHVLDQVDTITNSGGEPPGSEVGMKTPTRGIYGRVYSGGALYADRIQFSIPKFPTMVPSIQAYSCASDSKGFYPRPWLGEVVGGVPGGVVAMAYGGGVSGVFGPTTAWRLSSAGDGTLFPLQAHTSKGAASDGAAVGTPSGVHAVGWGSWLVLSSDDTRDIADGRFSDLLETIPGAYRNLTVMGYYGYKDQVWAAVVKSGETVARRILVWDRNAGGSDEFGRPIGALVYFDPACLAADEGITALCEYAYSGADPVMLAGTSKGRILEYPSGTNDAGTEFAAQWRGYFGQSLAQYPQRISSLEVHAGASASGNVTLKWMRMRASSETDTENTLVLQKSNALVSQLAALNVIDGRLWRLEFSSGSTVTARWEIDGVFSKVEVTSRR